MQITNKISIKLNCTTHNSPVAYIYTIDSLTDFSENGTFILEFEDVWCEEMKTEHHEEFTNGTEFKTGCKIEQIH